MSSRVRPPEDNEGVAAISWRQVYSAAPVQGAASVEEPADSAQKIAVLEKQWEQRVRDAHAAGQREGETAGRARAGAELQPAIDRMARAIEEIGGLRARLRAEAEADLADAGAGDRAAYPASGTGDRSGRAARAGTGGVGQTARSGDLPGAGASVARRVGGE